MIHELRTYTMVPGGVREYVRIYNECGRAHQVRLLGHLVAMMIPESGDLNQLVYHWAFDSLEDRARRRTALLADPDFAEFRKQVRGLLVQQESRLLTSAPEPVTASVHAGSAA
ncbi:NIPSNAP family protein [Herbaspirillum huttiense]|uniref:NIPSNAP family protein n=1 Tax=Herbaspirillum huttiense TaxID=863372 RepID=UPI00034581C8|nr:MULTISPECIES: NIPSNAP family protein [Herbaspirillum]UWE15629.1 NIPSNAP family protein [Herbaspirillum huttiense]